MENLAAKKLRENRWDQEVYCVECSSTDVIRNGKREDGVQQYRCKSCGLGFNDRSGTIFSDTQMSLEECFQIIKLRKEESLNSIASELGRSWKTVSDFVRLLDSRPSVEEISEEIEEDRESDVDYSRIGCGSSPDQEKHLRIQ